MFGLDGRGGGVVGCDEVGGDTGIMLAERGVGGGVGGTGVVGKGVAGFAEVGRGGPSFVFCPGNDDTGCWGFFKMISFFCKAASPTSIWCASFRASRRG